MDNTGERYLPSVWLNSTDETGIEHIQRYQFVLPHLKRMTVLDAACGEGYGSAMIAEVAQQVVGINVSDEAIEHARKKYQIDNLSFRHNSIESLPFRNDSFDAIVSFETIEHVSKEVQMSFIKEVRRVLKNEGIFVISSPNKRMTDYFNASSSFHKKELFPEELLRYLDNEFEYIRLYHQYHESSCFLLSDYKANTSVRIHGAEKRLHDEAIIIAVASANEQSIWENLVALPSESVYYEKQRQLINLHKTVADLQAENIRQKTCGEKKIAEKELEIQDLKSAVLIEQDEIQKQREAFINSTSWKVTKPFRWITGKLRRYKYKNNNEKMTAEEDLNNNSRTSLHRSLLRKSVNKIKREGFLNFLRAARPYIKPLTRRTLHYENIAKEPQEYELQPIAPIDGVDIQSSPFHLLYIIGVPEGESKRYRVYNILEALLPYGITGEAVFSADVPGLQLHRYSAVVFFRCALDDLNGYVLKECNKLSIPTIYDADDLVFDESIIGQIDGVRYLDEEQYRMYVSGVRLYRAMLEACDYATSPTKYLSKYMQSITGKKAFIIPNGMNQSQITTASSLEESEHTSEKIEIGFLSGTRTHNMDFEQATEALVSILSKHSNISLVIIGLLDLPAPLKPFHEKITHLPLMDPEALLRYCSRLYAVIIPLEYETPFCNAKSELKYFEQALIGVPVIASPTKTYKDCITNGINGLLAKDTHQWENALERIISDKAFRDSLAKNARKQIEGAYFPHAIGKIANEAYREILQSHAARKVDLNNLRIAFLIPEPEKGAGGHRNIFRIVRRFVEIGHRVTVYTFDPTLHGTDKSLREFVTNSFFETGAMFVAGCENIACCDIIIATFWTTAYIAQRFRHRCVLAAYFIQDFEPYFYTMSEAYVQAYETYNLGLAHLASGKWMAEMVERVSGEKCPYFEFPIQREFYYCSSIQKREANKVVFFARPDMPRRCYQLGVDALKLLYWKRPSTCIVLYGDEAYKYSEHGFAYQKAGMLKGPQELGELYRSADVGICFSLTNPSLVPFEMMACGLPVVDLDFNNSQFSYDGYDVALLSKPTPQAICDCICMLLEDTEEAEKRRLNGLVFTAKMPDENEIGDFAVAEWVKALEREVSDNLT